MKNNKFRFISIVMLFASVVMLSSCNSGSATAPTKPVGVNVSMDTASGGIANASTNVDLNPLIVIKFSAAIDPKSINADNILLSSVATGVNPVLLTKFTINKANTKVSFSVKNLLNPNLKYYLIVKNVLATDSSLISGNFYFTTGSTKAPKALMINPLNGEDGIWNSVKIQLLFNQTVSSVDINSISLHLGAADGDLVPIAKIIKNNDDENIYTIIPLLPLGYSKTYYVVLNSNIGDSSGNKLVPQVFNFTTVRQPFLYIANYFLGTVVKCALTPDGTPIDCMDSGVGAIFPNANSLSVNYSSNKMYVVTPGTSTVMECKIGDDGGFSDCKKNNNFYFEAPTAIAVNQQRDVLYILSTPNGLYDSGNVQECFYRDDRALFDCYKGNISNLVNAPNSLNSQMVISNNSIYIAGILLMKCNFDNFGLIINSSCNPVLSGSYKYYGVDVSEDYGMAYTSDNLKITACRLETNGSFSKCVTALGVNHLSRLTGTSPGQIIINKYNGNFYFPSVSYNNLIYCKNIDGNYAEPFCAAPISLPANAIGNGVPNSVAVTIRY